MKEKFRPIYSKAVEHFVPVPCLDNEVQDSFLDWMEAEGILSSNGTATKKKISDGDARLLINEAKKNGIAILQNEFARQFICWLADNGYIN